MSRACASVTPGSGIHRLGEVKIDELPWGVAVR